MTEAKVMPLPWAFQANGCCWRNGGYVSDGCSIDGGSPFTAYGETRAECLANVKFIIRACNMHDDLLEACKMALGEWNHMTAGMIKAAIAKAERGGS